jgi:argininosuccinate synthase
MPFVASVALSTTFVASETPSATLAAAFAPPATSSPCEKSLPTIRIEPVAGTNGIGRVDMVENRVVGMKSRGVYETPGGTLIMAAHRELESLCLDRQTRYQKDLLSITYGQMVYEGHWFTPLREAMDAFFNKTQEVVTGAITMSLYKGTMAVKSRKSPFSLYRYDIASFDTGSYNHHDAEGFINLLGLPAAVRSQIQSPKLEVRKEHETVAGTF